MKYCLVVVCSWSIGFTQFIHFNQSKITKNSTRLNGVTLDNIEKSKSISIIVQFHPGPELCQHQSEDRAAKIELIASEDSNRLRVKLTWNQNINMWTGITICSNIVTSLNYSLMLYSATVLASYRFQHDKSIRILTCDRLLSILFKDVQRKRIFPILQGLSQGEGKHF